MGEVAVTIRVYPESAERLESVKRAVSEIVKVVKVSEEEIAFGLKALVITFIMGDESGLDALEEKIGALPDVSQVQVVGMDRI
ncbi:MAG: hypothetical protein QXH30_01275 [Candidatus Bilamarchaeaceae archaeon]